MLAGIATPGHQKAFDTAPDVLDGVELWTVGRQLTQLEVFRFPLGTLVLNQLGPVKASIIENDDGQFST